MSGLERRRRTMAYTLLAPGVLFLLIFFVIPLINQLWVSLMTGNADKGFEPNWNWSVYPDSIDKYSEQLLRSVGYAATATVLCLIIAFPLAYFMASRRAATATRCCCW